MRYHTFHCFFTVCILMALPVGVLAQTREVAVTFLSWYQPFGFVVGCDKWSSGAIGYAQRATAGLNRPSRAQSAAPKGDASPVTFGLSDMGARYIRSELTSIREAGFDIVAYDMLPDPRPKRPAIDGPGYCALDLFGRYGEIASELNLKMAVFSDIKNISADHPNGYTFKANDWVSAYGIVHDMFGSKPWYWRPVDAPAIFQFGATEGAIEGVRGVEAVRQWARIAKQLSDSGKKMDILLDVRPIDVSGAGVPPFNSNLRPFIFAPGAPFGFLNDFMARLASENKYPIWSVSPGYYSRRHNVYLPPDFRRIHDTYTRAIASNARLMLVNTWNDFAEDTDIMPSTAKSNAMAYVFEYYNRWFKAHIQPPIGKSAVVLNIPRTRLSEVASGPPSWGNGAAESEGARFGQVVYYWALMRDAGWIMVNGDRTLLPKGVSFGHLNAGKPRSMRISTSFEKNADVQINDESGKHEKDSALGRTYNSVLLEE